MSKPALEKKMLTTSFGRIAYLETGSADKPPLLFVHGIPTSSYLWRHVIRFLQNDFHCYAPDLMGLGDTEADPKTVPFHMDNEAEMLVEFMTTLGHESFGLICHDQGGAAAQIIAARQPDRISCFVITNCVCYDNWPVPVIRMVQRMLQVPLLPAFMTKSGIGAWLQTSEWTSAFKRGVFDPKKLTNEAIVEYLRPTTSKAGAERFKAFTLAGDPRYTERAVSGLKKFDKPTIIIWGADDHYLSPSWGKKLLEDIPGAERFEIVPFCGHFWQEERPSEFSSIMGQFLSAHLGTGRASSASKSKNRTAKKDKSLPLVAAVPDAEEEQAAS
jgi:pimeloyl-ACP methyl ester carboxylesterase